MRSVIALFQKTVCYVISMPFFYRFYPPVQSSKGLIKDLPLVLFASVLQVIAILRFKFH